MSKQEFLDNFRIARNLFVHPQVRADSPHIDTKVVEQRLIRAAIWLTPKSVKGFNATDFAELGPDRQQELTNAIQEFSNVAKQVPPTAPASPQQFSEAATAMSKALAILQAYLPTPDEGRRTEAALKSVDFPPWVANWDYEFGSNEDGDPAIWVTVYADEQSAPRREFGRVASELTGKIRSALSASGIERWPYVRMRTAVEYKSA